MRQLVRVLPVLLCVSCNLVGGGAEDDATTTVETARSDADSALGSARDEATEAVDEAVDEATEAVEDAVADATGWIELFNGKDLSGWKINENPESWSVENGLIVVNGDRSHLFYEADEPFVDFELEAEVLTKEHSNSGIYFHTRFQPTGWPKYGFEAQVNNSYHDPQKTASLYGVVPNTTAPVEDDRWFTMRIRVEGKHVLIQVDGKTITDYTEPDDAVAGADFTRVLDEGTFALQGHDPESTVMYRRIRVRRL